MKRRKRFLQVSGLTCCLFLLVTDRVFSQARPPEETRSPSQVGKVSTVIGASVQLKAGGAFGKIDDIIIDDQGCIDFVIVVFEDKLFAIPFSITRVDFAKRVVTLDTERELLLRAASFTRTKFPDLSADSEFGRKVLSHFQSQTQRKEKASESRQQLAKSSLPVGRWSVEFTNGVKEVCEIRKDRRVSVVEPMRTAIGRAQIKDGSVLIVYQDDRIERWTPVGKKMLVEHWHPSALFPSGTPVLGFAEAAR